MMMQMVGIFTGPMPQRIEDGLVRNAVLTLHGPARFTGPASVDIDGAEYHGSLVLVATGSRPRPLDFPGSRAPDRQRRVP